MNITLINALHELQEFAKITHQSYKEKAYKRVILEIKRLTYPITTLNVEDVLRSHKIPGVGDSLAAKIKEFIFTGRIKELDFLRNDERVKSYQELGKITGVGPATIERWMSMGITTLSAVRNASDSGKITLNNMQKYGLEYYNDLCERILRNEVTEIGNAIKKILTRIDPIIIFTIAGSYRRGSETSGDIDILVSNRERFNNNLFKLLIDELQKDNNFIITLSSGESRVTFLYRGPYNKVRQIDILNIKYSSYYAALLYFTGSDLFNEAMRSYAKIKGMRLNQHGLYKYIGKKEKHVVLIPTNSEEEIFAEIGLKYVIPAERNEPKIEVLG